MGFIKSSGFIFIFPLVCLIYSIFKFQFVFFPDILGEAIEDRLWDRNEAKLSSQYCSLVSPANPPVSWLKTPCNIWERSTWMWYYKHLYDGLGSFKWIRKCRKKTCPPQDSRQCLHWLHFILHGTPHFVLTQSVQYTIGICETGTEKEGGKNNS